MSASQTRGRRHTIRVIGGDWRGRRLPVADAPGLRPTPDRARETLFNWLAGELPGARCVDLFAGTGALGIEALSRGAAAVTFVERNAALAAGLRERLAALGAGDRARVLEADALALPPGGRAVRADIVFIDPPFEPRLHARALDAAAGLIQPDGRVYLEYPQAQASAIEALFGGAFTLVRCRRAGRVGFCLARGRAAGQHGRP